MSKLPDAASLGLFGAEGLKYNQQHHPEWFAPIRPAKPPPPPRDDRAALMRAIAPVLRQYIGEQVAGVVNPAIIASIVREQLAPIQRSVAEVTGRLVTKRLWNSDLEIKAIDEDARLLTGRATT